jgi:protein O-mannosyl-transferase
MVPLDDTAQAPRSARRTTAELLVLAAAVVTCYANSLGVPFHLDDEVHIALNPGLGSWAPSQIDPPSRRVAYLSFKLDYRLHGLEPAGFHVTNAAIHVLAAFAVYALARLLLARARRGAGAPEVASRAALAGALLWAVHPIQTQAVTYVVQRITSLASLFYVAALALYAAARSETGARRAVAYGAALASGVLGMLTKEIAFTLPFSIALLEAAFFEGPPLRRAAWLAPVLALLPIVPWLRLAPAAAAAGGVAGAAETVTRIQTDVSRLDYLATQTRVVVTYLRLLVLPVGQNLDWDFPVEHGFGSPGVILSTAFLLGLLGAGTWLLARGRAPGARVAGYGIVLFFVALSVESSVIPIMDVIFEHRVYLPSVGAALAVAGLAAEVMARRPAAAPWTLGALAAAALALGVATVARNRVWRDPLTLWRDVAEKSPNKARPHFAIGNFLRDAGDLAGAEREWLRAAELDPTDSAARNQLGSLAIARGDFAAAEAHLRRALEAPGILPDVYYNLALVLEATGRRAEALAMYRNFVEHAPPDRAREVAEVRARFGWR